MQPTLLATKFHRPAPPPKRVERARLVEKLNEGLKAGRQISLISAPAGYGKTSLAAEWLAGVQEPVAWLSLDEADNDPLRFCSYLLGALRRVHAGLGEEIQAVLKSGQLPPAELLVTTLVNELSTLRERVILALDDYQVLAAEAIHVILGQIVAHQPNQLHLAIASREDPQLPLASLRVRNQVTEVRAADLRFSGEETERFLREVMGLSLRQEDVLSLEGRTEGWIAGLQLAGLSMQGRENPAEFIKTLSGSHRYILGYLTEEVLGRREPEVQDFLLRTSILTKLNADLCDAMTGRDDSAQMLERLFHENLFLVPLDDEGRWYRYHHLFGDLLRSLHGRASEDEHRGLHERAAQWYDSHDLGEEAMRHALAAQNYPLAVHYLERYASRLVMQGYARTVETWMEAIPEAQRARSPKADMAFAWMHLLRGSYAQIAPFLERVASALEDAEFDAGEAAALRFEMDALQSNLLHLQGKVGESIALARQVLDSAHGEDFKSIGLANLGLGGAYRQAGDFDAAVAAYQEAIEASRAAGNLTSEMLGVSALTLMALQHGKLRFAAETGRQAIERMGQPASTFSPVVGGVYGSLGLVQYEWNELEEAVESFARGERLSALSGHNASLIYMKAGMARIHQANGDLQAAARDIQAAADLLRHGAPAWLQPEVIHQQVRLYLAQNNPLAAEAVLREHQVGFPAAEDAAALTHPREQLSLALLRLILYRANENGEAEDLRAGIDLASRMIEETVKGQRIGIAIQAVLLRAALRSMQGEIAASLEDLERALELGEAEDYVRTFIDEGPAIATLLNEIRETKTDTAYLRKLREALLPAEMEAEATPVHPSPGGAQSPVEALSERELEVLALIAEGLKYEEIAERLVISVNTVRFHVKSIYGKLNVNNRTQAVERARGIGVLQ